MSSLSSALPPATLRPHPPGVESFADLVPPTPSPLPPLVGGQECDQVVPLRSPTPFSLPPRSKWMHVASVLVLVSVAAIAFGIACALGAPGIPEMFLQQKAWIPLIAGGGVLFLVSAIMLSRLDQRYEEECQSVKLAAGSFV